MNDVLVSLVGRAAEAVEPLIAAVGEAQHDRPTPCPDLDLRDLTAHLIGGLAGFADVAEGKPLSFAADPDLSRGDAVSTFRTEAERVISGFGGPGAVDRVFPMPWGPTTGAQLLGFELIELLVHGWDIARSLDTEPTFDDDLVAATLDGARRWVDDSTRVPQLFGPEVPVDPRAPVLDQLVGFLGRDPAWRAGDRASPGADRG